MKQVKLFVGLYAPRKIWSSLILVLIGNFLYLPLLFKLGTLSNLSHYLVLGLVPLFTILMLLVWVKPFNYREHIILSKSGINTETYGAFLWEDIESIKYKYALGTGSFLIKVRMNSNNVFHITQTNEKEILVQDIYKQIVSHIPEGHRLHTIVDVP